MVADEFGPDKIMWREVNLLNEMDYAVQLGAMASPAIAIDGQLVFCSLPSVAGQKRTIAVTRAIAATNIP